MIRSFKDYMDVEDRKALRQLKIVQSLLEHSGMKVTDFTKSEDDQNPYIFVYNTAGNKFFDGIRIYSIGKKLAYRVQKEERTHPFGTAYPLKIEEMFNDLIAEEDINQEKAGKEIIEQLPKILKKFFERSAEAEKEIIDQDIRDKSDENGAGMRSTGGTDYSQTVHNKGAGGGSA
tara:strand:+ start:441 stop:965 length:525 start_codon:yes stop_codon:yes gene_type:complete